MVRHEEFLYHGLQPYTLLDFARFRSIYRLLRAVRGLEGDIGELGVYKGGIAALMALAAPGKRLHLFDTFTGLREPEWSGEHHGVGGFADTSLPDVLTRFPPSTPVDVHEGWFPETVTDELRETRFAFLHIDGDYYETTRDALEFFYPRLQPQGVMVFDDWDWVHCPGVKRALLENQTRFGYEIALPVPYQAYICKRG